MILLYLSSLLFYQCVLSQNWWSFDRSNVNERPLFTPLPERRYTHQATRYYSREPNDIVINIPKAGYGSFVGFSERVYYDYTWTTWPPIKGRLVNVFLGIPYAAPPINELRFKKPFKAYIEPGFLWYARKYKPSCMQSGAMFNTSEDCLYLNVFSPNRTWDSPSKLYPVTVFIHGGTFVKGSSRNYPGHVLASNGMVVVTFNYRLGPFGFLATGDFESIGNYGLWDQLLALEWIKENIVWFRGDPNRITIMGHEAGAASIGLMIASPVVSTPNMKNNVARPAKPTLFQQAIFMSGSELSPWALANPDSPSIKSGYSTGGGGVKTRRFVEQLAYHVGCTKSISTSSTGTFLHRGSMHRTMQCLRYKVSEQQLLKASEKISAPNGAPQQVWSPVIDGTAGFIPRHPRELRKFDSSVPVLMSVVHSEAAFMVEKVLKEKFNKTLQSVLSHKDVGLVIEDFVEKTNAYRVNDTVEELRLRYTWWSNLFNKTARTETLVAMYSDYFVRSPVYETMLNQPQPIAQKKSGEINNQNYFGVWAYRGLNDTTPKAYDIYQGVELPFVFGLGFFNRSTSKPLYDDDDYNRNIVNIDGGEGKNVLKSDHLLDRITWNYPYDTNMSEFAMTLWTNFIKNGNPTPKEIKNITWLPFTNKIQNYVHLYINSSEHKNYRKNQMAFWRQRFYQVAQLLPAMQDLRSYPFYEAQKITIILAVGVGLILIALIITIYFLCKKPAPEQFKTKVRLRDGDKFSSAFHDQFAGYQAPSHQNVAPTSKTYKSSMYTGVSTVETNI